MFFTLVVNINGLFARYLVLFLVLPNARSRPSSPATETKFRIGVVLLLDFVCRPKRHVDGHVSIIGQQPQPLRLRLLFAPLECCRKLFSTHDLSFSVAD